MTRVVACDEIVRAQQGHVTIPRRIMYPIRDMVVMQERFHSRGARHAERLAQHQRFRAAYDLLLLRASSGEADGELAQWWTDYQDGNAEPEPPPQRTRRRPRRRRRSRGRRPRTGNEQ